MAIITEIDSDSSDSESTLGYSTAAEGALHDPSPFSESDPAELPPPAEFIETPSELYPEIEADPDQCSSELVPLSSVQDAITPEELDRTTKTAALTGGGKHSELSVGDCDNNNYLEEPTSSMSLDRPLRIPAPSPQPSFRNQISRRYSFVELMQAALTAIFAVVLSWRLFLFPSRNGSSSSTSAIEGSSRSVDDPEAQPVREAARQTSEDTRLLEAGLEMSSEETPSSPVRGPSSVLSLLSTDAMPESSSSDGEDRPPPPMPSLLQPVPLPAYLDTINEEESDDLRSISSASFLSPRSNADRLSIDPQNRSETISDSDYRSPVAPSPIVIIPKEALEDEDEEEEEVQTPKEDDEHTEVEQVDKSIGAPSPGILDSSVDSADVTVIERVTVTESDEEELIEEPVGSVENVVDDKSKVAQLITTDRKEEPKEATTDLLKGLAKLGQESQIRTIAEAEGQSEPAVSENEQVEPQTMSAETVRTIPVEETHSAKESRLVEQQRLYDVVPTDVTLPTPQDADRDQGEELFFNEERRKTVTMDDSLSLNSVSINLNNTKDSLLDRSLADNITDETAVMQSSMQFKEPLSTQRPSYRPPSPPTDLPPPPPPPPPHSGGAIPPAPLLTAPPVPPPPAFPTTAPPPPPLFASTSTSVASSAASSARLPPPSPPKFNPTAEILRRAQDLATDDIPQQFAPEVPRHTATSNVAGTFSSRSSESGPPSEAPPPPPPIQSLPTPPSFASNYSTTSNFGQADLLQRNMIDSARRVYNPYDRTDQGMSSPPIDAPPPPPPVYSVKSGHSSREDLLGDVGGRDAGNTTSRSTVREIPVHRAPSAAPSNSTVTVLDYRMPTTTYPPPLDGQDEYYRREVLTRTIITRSTDALNQQPLGRSSPIERYISYPDPNTREERTVDYKVTYHRNIEEEERRIREEQDRRRQEEEDRRRREEESRRQWELREREVLENMRLVRERKEKEVELSIRDRERLEKDRIDKDRAARERAEMQRRADWERMEDERRRLEEDELTRRRRLEKERLEKERLEMERLERERLERERERLERERLEAERKEAERLERIRIERERIERERIEIERIERIKRERIERERKEKEKEREEQERLRREREELERIERERREIEIREREELERARREAEEREKQRLEDEAKEARRREEERREQLLLEDIQRQAEERERLRRQQEREEQERLDRIRREQQRLEQERADADRRERERAEEERRERELLEAAQRKKAERDRERLEEAERERVRQEEERRERERHEAERRAAAERERQRREEEDRERQKLLDLERAAAERRALRAAEIDRERERDELDRKARELAELERRENERRERERRDEERSLMELREKEKRNQEIRDRERQEAAEREATRRLDDRRSRDKLDILVRERSEKERFEAEKRRLLQEKEQMSRRRNHLTSSETLQKLTKPPYYSRDNLNTEVTTKVEREVIERVDRNVWVDDRLYPIGSTQPAISYSLDSTQEDAHRDRLYNPRDLDRTGSGRTSKYHRSKMEKARRDFFTGGPDSADPAERFRKSVDDLNSSTRGRPEFRGPLLQKFHEGEFKSRENVDMPYSRVGPSPYSQVEETNLDEVHRRSGSVVDYHRQSRRDVAEESAEPVHTRSRSADYLMDRRLREETAPPENELQKTMGETSPRHSKMSEAEMRFHKSTEKLTVPDWYRDSRKTARPTDLDSTMPRTGWESRAEPERYELSYPQPSYYQPYHQSQTSTTPTGIDIPRGMFDKYKEEIADMRRSRTSIHQLGMDAPTPAPQRQEERPSPAPRRSLSQETISSRVLDATSSRALPGYTVSQVPAEWNVTRTRSSRVIEVADTFVGPKQPVDGKVSLRYGGRVTIEEVLDSIFQHTPPSPVRHRHISGPQADEVYQGSPEAPGIYSQNYNLMEQVIRNPEQAEDLLKSEHLFVRCARCYRTRELSQARLQYVSCKYCYTYYCSRECRQDDWPKHNTRCSFARINTLCKDVIMKVREDSQAQAFMSRIAREGYSASGRGSVNIRLASPQLAQAYVTNGWQALAHAPLQQLLYYYTVEALVQERKEPSLIALCRRYDPREKFILSVSIIADIEHCPETPPPETTYPDSQFQSPTQRYDPYQEASSFYAPPVYATTPLTLVPTDV